MDVSIEQLNIFFKDNYKLFVNYGGDIEILVNQIKYEQSLRCFKNNSNNNDVTIDDITESIKKIKSNKIVNEPPYGMY